MVSLQVNSTEHRNTCDYANDWYGLYLSQFKPFSVCGKLAGLQSSFKVTTTLENHLRQNSCTIACLNKTQNAVLMGIHACSPGPMGILFPISVDYFDFRACYSNSSFALNGLKEHRRLQIRLEPDISCLRKQPTGACQRIFKYNKDDLDTVHTFQGHLGTNEVEIELNWKIWKASVKSDGDFGQISWILILSSVVLQLQII
ncbi:hypothetical protein ZHAS_00008860 [Anopheles sinensis]|uniref:Uncharacterized protein n=1 Tax=Anopheles sinensis TaxID=74873 RepID=A0A084VTH5_ANOSI|nr:hypothetical protein ZHAS_00008860 [Anopheles sinensis]